MGVFNNLFFAGAVKSPTTLAVYFFDAARKAVAAQRHLGLSWGGRVCYQPI
jgi:hypothetical protein